MATNPPTRVAALLKILFGILCVATGAALPFGIICLVLFPMVVYDYNYQVMHDVLTPDQASRITQTVRSWAMKITWPLLATNVGWIIAFVITYARGRSESAPVT